MNDVAAAASNERSTLTQDLQAVLSRGHDMKRIGGMEKCRFGQTLGRRDGDFNQRRADRYPCPDAGRAIVFELSPDFLEGCLAEGTFTPLAVEHARNFEPSNHTAIDTTQALGQGANRVAIRLVQVELRDIG